MLVDPGVYYHLPRPAPPPRLELFTSTKNIFITAGATGPTTNVHGKLGPMYVDFLELCAVFWVKKIPL